MITEGHCLSNILINQERTNYSTENKCERDRKEGGIFQKDPVDSYLRVDTSTDKHKNGKVQLSRNRLLQQSQGFDKHT